MGAPPKISLLELSPRIFYKCQMCGQSSRKNRFSWKSWLTDSKLLICRECAYKETYGTVGMKTAKKKEIT